MIKLFELSGVCRYCVALLLLCAPVWSNSSLSAQQGVSQSQPTHSDAAEAGDVLPAGLDAKTRAQLAPILARARDRGLPVHALTAKAAEGLLRGVPASRIVTAVEALEERLTTAHLALSPAQAPDIVAGADALAVGVNVGVLRSIRRFQPKNSVAVPLAVLAQLVSQGVSQTRATEIVFKLLERGVTPQQLLALRKAVNEDILAGKSASRALDSRAATIFAALGQTTANGGAMPSTVLENGGSSVFTQSSGKKK